MDLDDAVTALAGALHASAGAPALRGLALPRYPAREFRPREEGNRAVLHVSKIGWEYKHRGPKPKHPPIVDPAAVRATLNRVMPSGVVAVAVVDKETYISVVLKIE